MSSYKSEFIYANGNYRVQFETNNVLLYYDVEEAITRLMKKEEDCSTWDMRVDENGKHIPICKFCGKESTWFTKYCPHCGRRMKKKDE